jgi:hypothetical protein
VAVCVCVWGGGGRAGSYLDSIKKLSLDINPWGMRVCVCVDCAYQS